MGVSNPDNLNPRSNFYFSEYSARDFKISRENVICSPEVVRLHSISGSTWSSDSHFSTKDPKDKEAILVYRVMIDGNVKEDDAEIGKGKFKYVMCVSKFQKDGEEQYLQVGAQDVIMKGKFAMTEWDLKNEFVVTYIGDNILIRS